MQDWDALCIAELQAAQQAAGHQSVVLSTYPLGFDGEGAAAAVPDAAAATLLCAKEFDEAGLLRIKSRWVRPFWVCVERNKLWPWQSGMHAVSAAGAHAVSVDNAHCDNARSGCLSVLFSV